MFTPEPRKPLAVHRMQGVSSSARPPIRGKLALISMPGGAVLDDYAASMRRRRLAANTIRLRLFYVRKLQAWLPCPLPNASLEMLEAYADSGNWTAATQQTVIASMKSFYTWAQRTGLTPTNTAADLYNVRVIRKRSRIASDTDLIQALATANIPDQAMLLLGAECGLRVAEIAALNVDDRDDDHLTIIGKGGRQRTVFLTPELTHLLDSIEETTMRHGHYFPGQSGIHHMHPSTVWRHIRDVAHTNPHSLRHRAGTAVYRASGNDLRLAQEFLGHASPNTTAIYVHIEDDDLRRAAFLARLA